MVREIRRFIPLRKIARGKLDLSEGIDINISPSFMQSFFIIPKKYDPKIRRVYFIS